MKKSIGLFICLLVMQVCLGSVPVLARTAQDSGKTEDPAAQQRIEYAAYELVDKEKDFSKKYQLAQDFKAKYPNSQYVTYVNSRLNVARYMLVYKSRDLKNYDDQFRYGSELLADPAESKKGIEELRIMLLLASDAGFLALGGKPQYLDNGGKFAQLAIQKIEAGEKIDDKTINWDAEKPKNLAQLYRTVGIAAANAKKADEAFAALEKSIGHDCTDPYTYYYMATLYQNKYEEAALKFNGLADKKTQEAADVLNVAKEKAGKVAEYFAKTIAAGQTAKDPAPYAGLVGACRKQIEQPYGLSHDGKTDGLDAYIEEIKSGLCKQ